MDFDQCALIFNRYPENKTWKIFFSYHYPFWQYVLDNSKALFPVNIVYPVNADTGWNVELYFQENPNVTLENFFALYFLLIVYRHNLQPDHANYFYDQDLWKSLWDREQWSSRVDEKKLVSVLSQYKLELSHKSQQSSTATLNANLEL